MGTGICVPYPNAETQNYSATQTDAKDVLQMDFIDEVRTRSGRFR